jgi:hypothetical protein
MTGPGYQPEHQRDQRPIGPGHLRPDALAELALQDGELMVQQQDLGDAPGFIAAREPRRGKQTGRKEEDET